MWNRMIRNTCNICNRNIGHELKKQNYNSRLKFHPLITRYFSNNVSSKDVKKKLIPSDQKSNDYIGVIFEPEEMKKYRVQFKVDGKEIDGGRFWSPIDAAKAYDSLAKMYYDEESVVLNFPDIQPTSNPFLPDSFEWINPAELNRDQILIPIRKGQYLTLEEVKEGLEKEKAIDVKVIDLAGKSKLGDYMVFCTGRSTSHIRKMADGFVDSIKRREIKDGFDYSVEGRDCEDWMLVDANNIIIHFLLEGTRRLLNLEQHWSQMKDDKHMIYGEMNEEEYVEKFGAEMLYPPEKEI